MSDHLYVAETKDWTGTQNEETRMRVASVDEVLAWVRAWVESGTIKGEVVETENCGREPNCTCPGFIEYWTRPGTYLLIGPVSDGGSET